MRIISNGTSLSTEVYDNNGDKIKLDLDRITIDITSHGGVSADLLISQSPSDIDVPNNNVSYFIGWEGKLEEVKRIEFVNGEVWEKPE